MHNIYFDYVPKTRITLYCKVFNETNNLFMIETLKYKKKY